MALGVRLGLAPFHGFFHDVQAYAEWGNLLRQHPFDPYSAGAELYRQGRLVFPPNYPPLTLDIYAALTRVYLWSAPGPESSSFAMPAAPGLAVLMKLPSIMADLACATIIFRLGLRVGPPRRALLVGCLYALSPALIINGALWGQTDGVAACLVMAALAAALRGRGATAGVASAAAVMLKPQPLVFLPLIVFYLWRRWGVRAAGQWAAATAASVAAVWLPFATGHLGEAGAFSANVSTVVAAYPDAAFNAFNLWWLTGAAGLAHNAPYIAGLSIDVLGGAALAITLGLVCLSLYRAPSEERLLLGAALVAGVFFVAGSLQRERYLVPVVPLLAAAALYSPSHLWLLAAATLSATLNMLLVALPSLPPPHGLGRLDWWYAPHPSVARLLAIANLGLAFALLERFLRQRGGESLAPAGPDRAAPAAG